MLPAKNNVNRVFEATITNPGSCVYAIVAERSQNTPSITVKMVYSFIGDTRSRDIKCVNNTSPKEGKCLDDKPDVKIRKYEVPRVISALSKTPPKEDSAGGNGGSSGSGGGNGYAWENPWGEGYVFWVTGDTTCGEIKNKEVTVSEFDIGEIMAALGHHFSTGIYKQEGCNYTWGCENNVCSADKQEEPKAKYCKDESGKVFETVYLDGYAFKKAGDAVSDEKIKAAVGNNADCSDCVAKYKNELPACTPLCKDKEKLYKKGSDGNPQEYPSGGWLLSQLTSQGVDTDCPDCPAKKSYNPGTEVNGDCPFTLKNTYDTNQFSHFVSQSTAENYIKTEVKNNLYEKCIKGKTNDIVLIVKGWTSPSGGTQNAALSESRAVNVSWLIAKYLKGLSQSLRIKFDYTNSPAAVGFNKNKDGQTAHYPDGVVTTNEAVFNANFYEKIVSEYNRKVNDSEEATLSAFDEATKALALSRGRLNDKLNVLDSFIDPQNKTLIERARQDVKAKLEAYQRSKSLTDRSTYVQAKTALDKLVEEVSSAILPERNADYEQAKEDYDAANNDYRNVEAEYFKAAENAITITIRVIGAGQDWQDLDPDSEVGKSNDEAKRKRIEVYVEK
jgi:hypothetical protein